MFIDIITPEVAHQYMPVLDDMHRLRHRVFRERMNWDVTSVNGMEFDEFDLCDPTYIVCRDAEAVYGCWRLLPTTGDYMLHDVFADLLEGQPAPRAEDVWECSRFAVDCPVRENDGLYSVNAVTGTLFCALYEHALHMGIREMWTVYDIRIAKLLKRVGCEPAWSSGRKRIGNTIAVAGRFEMTRAALDTIRAAVGMEDSLVRVSPWRRIDRAA